MPFSEGTALLVAVTEAVTSDVNGQGQYRFGILKKSTGEGLTDIVKQGFQPSGPDKGVIFGGVFQEDNSTGCIGLS